MSVLDFNYVADLVKQSREGDTNSFAELYVATYKNLYDFALFFLRDEFAAQDALQETYIFALTNIARAGETSIVSWLNQIAFRTCLKKLNYDSTTDPEMQEVNVNERSYTVRNILHLPVTEAQVLLLKCFCGMKMRKIARMLEMRRSEARRYLKSGRKRLTGLGEKNGGEAA